LPDLSFYGVFGSMGTMLEKENKEKKGDDESRIYEVSYLLVPTIIEEELPAAYGDVKEMVSTSSTNIIIDEVPKMMPLAYEMTKIIKNVHNKFEKGYFGWTKFEADADKVDELKKKMEEDDRVIRFLIVKTVRENTLAGKRITARDSYKKRMGGAKRAEKREPVEINKEEIDKEIDTLVKE
jgi:ribosomal protein S6